MCVINAGDNAGPGNNSAIRVSSAIHFKNARNIKVIVRGGIGVETSDGISHLNIAACARHYKKIFAVGRRDVNGHSVKLKCARPGGGNYIGR